MLQMLSSSLTKSAQAVSDLSSAFQSEVTRVRTKPTDMYSKKCIRGMVKHVGMGRIGNQLIRRLDLVKLCQVNSSFKKYIKPFSKGDTKVMIGNDNFITVRRDYM